MWQSKAELRGRLAPQSKEGGLQGWREVPGFRGVVMERGDLAPLWMAQGSAEWEQRGRRGVGRLKSPFRRRGVVRGIVGAATSVAGMGACRTRAFGWKLIVWGESEG